MAKIKKLSSLFDNWTALKLSGARNFTCNKNWLFETERRSQIQWPNCIKKALCGLPRIGSRLYHYTRESLQVCILTTNEKCWMIFRQKNMSGARNCLQRRDHRAIASENLHCVHRRDFSIPCWKLLMSFRLNLVLPKDPLQRAQV